MLKKKKTKEEVKVKHYVQTGNRKLINYDWMYKRNIILAYNIVSILYINNFN